MRFGFGKNWSAFSENALGQERVDSARADFAALFEGIEFAGKRFLDIGFGQGLGLFLAAEKGADAHGIDIDRDNLKAIEFTARFFQGIKTPTVEVASILDKSDVQKLQTKGSFDIVQSWGVLHHTGGMWQAIQHASSLVKPGGYFVIAIYNRHWTSPIWLGIKWFYNILPGFLQRVMIGVFYPILYAATVLILRQDPKNWPRGMNFYHDVIDWVGGYPYEYASKEEIRNDVEPKGFTLIREINARGLTGNNQFVFKRNDSAQ